MTSNDGSYQGIEMQGLVSEWNGNMGYILTECGKRILLHRVTLKLLGFEVPPMVGDRICFWAS
jgi:hypothetical protein